MIENIKTLKDVEVKGKKVLLRVDFNVPLSPETGSVMDATRIRESLPTIKFLMDHGARVIIISHLGRPKGQVVENLKMDKIAKELEKMIEKPVKKLHGCCGKEIKDEIKKMKDSEVIMLENVRFWKEEEISDKKFVKDLASLGEIFVSDAFGVVHRDHASTAGLAGYLPAYAGLLLEKELRILSALIYAPEHPFTLVMGGAKIDTKIGLLKEFIPRGDNFLIGGALANTFLVAAGYNVGKSLYQADKIEVAREIMMMAEKDKDKFIIPHDVIAASEISNTAKVLDVPVQDIEGDMKILDIGSKTRARYCQIIEKSKTIIWNGPLGLCEYQPFEEGTRSIAKAIADSESTSIIGGGDTIEAIKKLDLSFENYTHVSTGGGAMLEYLEGRELPGVKCLKR